MEVNEKPVVIVFVVQRHRDEAVSFLDFDLVDVVIASVVVDIEAADYEYVIGAVRGSLYWVSTASFAELTTLRAAENFAEVWREGNVVEILVIAILVSKTEARLIDGGNVRHDFDRPELMILAGETEIKGLQERRSVLANTNLWCDEALRETLQVLGHGGCWETGERNRCKQGWDT
jgi:hypothetical protein